MDKQHPNKSIEEEVEKGASQRMKMCHPRKGILSKMISVVHIIGMYG